MDEPDSELEEGRRRLHAMLPKAKAALAAGDVSMDCQAMSDPLMRVMAPHVTEENFDALTVTPAPMGGWHADLVLKSTPPGVPDTIGTCKAMPMGTRAEAEAAGGALLVLALTVAAAAQALPRARTAAFVLNGTAIALVPELLDALIAGTPGTGNGYGSREAAIEQAGPMLAHLPVEKWQEWTTNQRVELMGMLHMAALSGLFEWPPTTDASPSGHTTPTTMH